MDNSTIKTSKPWGRKGICSLELLCYNIQMYNFQQQQNHKSYKNTGKYDLVKG